MSLHFSPATTEALVEYCEQVTRDDADAALRQEIVDAVNRPSVPEVIAEKVNALAEFHGRQQAFYTVLRTLKNQYSLEDATRELVRTLVRGADDGWSGRTNDVRRSRFDGFRKAVEEIQILEWS